MSYSILVLLLTTVAATQAESIHGSAPLTPPTIEKAFNPTTIAAGVTSQLTITISNPFSAATTLTAAFTDTMPSGVVIAAPAGLVTTCGGTVSATPGGSTVTLANGSSLPVGSCTIMVRVTAGVAGTYVNTIPANALQTDHGINESPTTSTLIVTSSCPVITLGPPTVTNGIVGQPYSQALTAGRGTAPYTFSITAGALRQGITMSLVGGMGLIAGTPTANGSHAFTVRVSDADNCPADLAYLMTTTTAVPTMPELFLMTLAMGLATAGYFQLRAR